MHHSLTKFIHAKIFKENDVKGDCGKKKWKKKKGENKQQSKFIFALNVCRKGLDSFLQLWQVLIQLWQ